MNREARALDRALCVAIDQLAVKDTQIKVLSEQNQRLVAAALAASANPVGASIVRIRTAVDEPATKAPVQHAVGM